MRHFISLALCLMIFGCGRQEKSQEKANPGNKGSPANEQSSESNSLPDRSTIIRQPDAQFLDNAQHTASAQAKAEIAAAEQRRFYSLGRNAKEMFTSGQTNEARQSAEELLDLLKIPRFSRDWNYGNAIQDANLVLGRIAVQQGRIEDAKRFLIQSGQSSGSPQMNSFGPNMSLAKDLLEKGEHEAVLDHFEACRKFWKMGGDRLDEWTKQVNEGKVPDFGANLVY